MIHIMFTGEKMKEGNAQEKKRSSLIFLQKKVKERTEGEEGSFRYNKTKTQCFELSGEISMFTIAMLTCR